MLIQPVIVAVPHQQAAVDRLVSYARKLDGTEIKVIPLSPEEDAKFIPEYPESAREARASFALHHAARAMLNQPFLWLEHDSIPLKAGWVKVLSEEYSRKGKPILLSSDTHPPDDLVGGIGIYPPTTSWLIPQNFRRESNPPRGVAWDLWIYRNLQPLIATTPLIQHSYGTYDHDHICTPHRFPASASILRLDTLIFHKDAHQDLLLESNRCPASPLPLYHSGDLGDIIYHLPTMRLLGGGKFYLGSNLGLPAGLPSRCREPMTLARVNIIKPLLEAQPYIHSVHHWPSAPQAGWRNLNSFRKTFQREHPTCCPNLQRGSLRHFGFLPQNETQPWLQLPPNPYPHTPRIAIARSPRYHRDDFPWTKLVKEHGSRMNFFGLTAEHKAFCEQFGPIPHILTTNLLDLAHHLASHTLFIGNQSCPYAIAEGLKLPAIQETWPVEPNCLFQRPNLLNQTSNPTLILDFISHYL